MSWWKDYGGLQPKHYAKKGKLFELCSRLVPCWSITLQSEKNELNDIEAGQAIFFFQFAYQKRREKSSTAGGRKILNAILPQYDWLEFTSAR